MGLLQEIFAEPAVEGSVMGDILIDAIQGEKALSWLGNSSGGALVAPPQYPSQRQLMDSIHPVPPESIIGTTVSQVGQWLMNKWIELERKYDPIVALGMAVSDLSRYPLPDSIRSIIRRAEVMRGLNGFADIIEVGIQNEDGLWTSPMNKKFLSPFRYEE